MANIQVRYEQRHDARHKPASRVVTIRSGKAEIELRSWPDSFYPLSVKPSWAAATLSIDSMSYEDVVNVLPQMLEVAQEWMAINPNEWHEHANVE